jgi:vacuolar protein sorting-associated protein VTA1
VTPPASPPPPSNNVRRASPPHASSSSPPQIKRSSPPAHIDITRASPPSNKSQPQFQTPPRSTYLGVDVEGHAHLGRWGGEGEVTPGSWSTAATPGTGQVSVEWEQVSPTRATYGQEEVKSGHKPRSGSQSSAGSGGSGGVLKKTAWVGEDLDPHAANQHYFSQKNGAIPLDTPETAGTSDSTKKSVRFTPSVVGGTSSDSVTPQISPVQDMQGYPGVAPGWHADPSAHISYESLPAHPPSQGNVFVDGTFPPGFVPDTSDWAASAPPLHIISPPSPPYQSSTTYYSPQRSQPPHISAPQPVHGQAVQNLHASAPPVELELSPNIIAKAQKHCRFAISALDYEDATQARKELRAALAVLGG